MTRTDESLRHRAPAAVRRPSRLTEWLKSIAVIVVSAGLGIAAARIVPTVAAAEYWSSDIRVAYLSRPKPQHPNIVIVGIDEDTLAPLPYRSPVDRGVLADLIGHLDRAGVRAIGIDMLYDQPTEPEKDARLRQALTTARAPVFAAWAETEDQLTEGQAAFMRSYLDGVGHGLVNVMTDPHFGTVRWIFPGRERDGVFTPSLAVAVAQAFGAPVPREPVDLVYRPPPDAHNTAFRIYPAHAVRLLPPSWFAGKIVLIGSNLPLTDRHRTPWTAAKGALRGLEPGVLMHAHALAQLLDGTTPRVVGLAGEVLLALAMAALAVRLALSNTPVAYQVALGILALPAFWAAGFFVFWLRAMFVPLTSPSIAFALAWVLGNVYGRGAAWRQREFIRQAFSRFADPSVVAQLIDDPSLLRLRGEKREITCVFSDLASFTAWFEAVEPEQALTTLNAYLDGMCRIAVEHGGTIDKIVGDALHVMFGAPIPQSDDPARAVRCAIAMRRFGVSFAEQQRAQGSKFGVTRVGVHTGQAVVGNFGGDRFFDYTAYGDTVNTAARLEGANKHLGTLVCVSGSTAARCPEMLFRPIGAVQLSGKQQEIECFEPLAPDDAAAATLEKYLVAFRRMRDSDPRAGQDLRELAAAYPKDALIDMHATRARQGETGTFIGLKEK